MAKKGAPKGPFVKFLLMDLAVYFGALASALYFLLHFGEFRQQNLEIYRLLILPNLFLRIISLLAFRLYNFSRPYSYFDLFYFSTIAMLLSHGAQALFFFYASAYYKYEISRQFLFMDFVISWLGHSGWRMLYLKRRRRWGYDRTRILILGAGELGESVLKDIKQYSRLGHQVVGLVDDDIEDRVNGSPVLGKMRDLPVLVKKHEIEEIIVTSRRANRQELLEIISTCQTTGCKVRLLPELYEVTIGQVEIEQVGGVPLITVDSEPSTDWGRFLKRSTDVVVSIATMGLLLPLLPPIALAIWMDSGAPIFYRQQRVGKGGRLFTVLKFRTMYQDAELKTGPVLSWEDDPRVTRVGRFLRRWHLDETSQLINVLKGEMSLVGPRPERPCFAANYAQEIPAYRLREAVRPGVTGLAQIHGFYNSPVEHKLRYDLAYINNMSLLLDLKILFLTLRVTFSNHGENS